MKNERRHRHSHRPPYEGAGPGLIGSRLVAAGGTALGCLWGAFAFPSTGFAASPVNGAVTFPQPANSLAEQTLAFHNNILLPLAFLVALFVFVLLGYTCYRFRERPGVEPSKTTHSTLLETVWTIIPVIIVAALVVPSVRLIQAGADHSGSEMTIKIVGHQWYWNYSYPDHGDFSFDSLMIPENEIQPGQERLMSVDNPMVVPVGTKIRLQITAADVLHSWAVQDFAIRMDATPGYLREVPLYPIKEVGTYYGFCSELCGANHAYMPVEVRAVTHDEFARWVSSAREEFAAAGPDSDVGDQRAVAAIP